MSLWLRVVYALGLRSRRLDEAMERQEAAFRRFLDAFAEEANR